MLVNVCYTHYASVRLGRARNPKTVLFPATATVDLREVDAVEAPLVLRYPAPTRGLRPRLTMVDIRKIDDSFFRPLVVLKHVGPENFANFAPLYATPDTLSKPPAGLDQFQSPFHGNPDQNLQYYDRNPAESDQPMDGNPLVKEILWDGRIEPRQRVLLKAADVVVLDGVPWERVDEPVILVDLDGEQPYVHVEESPSSIEMHFDIHEGTSVPFRMDEAEAAIAFASNIHPAPLSEVRGIEVVRPDLLNTSVPEFHSCRNAVRLYLAANADPAYDAHCEFLDTTQYVARGFYRRLFQALSGKDRDEIFLNQKYVDFAVDPANSTNTSPAVAEARDALGEAVSSLPDNPVSDPQFSGMF